MDRKEKILRHINPHGLGVEIGPSHNPVAPKKEGYHVHVIDHLNREELIAKYRDHPVELGNIEEVDFVWRGEGYAELTGNRRHYDWIIASHVIEHTPDLIGFLNECDSILKEEGVLSLVVPDKRYCFDHYRPLTGLGSIIDSHWRKNKVHTPGTVAEFLLDVVKKGGGIAWDATTAGEYQLTVPFETVRQKMNEALKQKEFIDVHAWCFVPHSFRLMMHDLFNFGFIAMKEIDFLPTEGCEFYVTLGRKGKGIGKTRLEMLELIDSER